VDAQASEQLLYTAERGLEDGSAASPWALPPELGAAAEVARMMRTAPSVEAAAASIAVQPRLARGFLLMARALEPADCPARATVERTVMTLGLFRVVPIVWSVAVQLVFHVENRARAGLLAQISRYSFARAEAMRWMANALEELPVSPLEVHQVGLLADAGAAFLVWCAELNAECGLLDVSVHELRATIAARHEGLGERLLRRWNLFDSAGPLARAHHSLGVDTESPVLQLAVGARAIVQQSGLAADPTGSDDGATACQTLARLGIGPEMRSDGARWVRSRLEQLDGFMARQTLCPG
jgi:hypothetical protein